MNESAFPMVLELSFDDDDDDDDESVVNIKGRRVEGVEEKAVLFHILKRA